MGAPIRWGILGAGHIARAFAQGLRTLPDARLAGVASRTHATAKDFARQVPVQRVYANAAELLADPAIDVIYIASPHPRHMDDALLCLEQGKAVLCEKPFTVNAREARRVVEVARKKRLFCMEAMWMRFIPAVQRARELVRAGAIGEPRLFTGSFCVANAYDPKSRFFDPALGGGALLDRGVYPLALATFLFGMPERITGQAGLAPTGVDEHSTVLMQFSGGRLAQFASSLSHTTRNEATIAGTHGRLLIHEPIYCPQQLTLTRYAPATVTAARAPGLMQRAAGLARGNPLVRGVYGGLRATLRRSEQSFKLPITGNGYNYEAAEVMRCLRAGELESPIMPLDESVRIMELMDEVRGQFGVRYPGE